MEEFGFGPGRIPVVGWNEPLSNEMFTRTEGWHQHRQRPTRRLWNTRCLWLPVCFLAPWRGDELLMAYESSFRITADSASEAAKVRKASQVPTHAEGVRWPALRRPGQPQAIGDRRECDDIPYSASLTRGTPGSADAVSPKLP